MDIYSLLSNTFVVGLAHGKRKNMREECLRVGVTLKAGRGAGKISWEHHKLSETNPPLINAPKVTSFTYFFISIFLGGLQQW